MGMKGLALWWAAGAVLALAACSGGGSQPGARQPGPLLGFQDSPPGLGRDGSRQPPATAIAGAEAGGVLTVLSDYGLDTLDPSEAYYSSVVSIESGLLVRSLTQYVYDPGSGQMILVPDLATDLGRPSNHFKTWAFTLRSGLRFDNGRPVTPQDLKYGIERSFDRTTFPGGASYSNQYLLHGNSYRGPYHSTHDYRGVTIDDNTITVRMARPFPDMPYWGSFPAISPIPAGRASDPATYKNHPWATGPYMIDSYTPGRSLNLVKNPYWRADTDPGRHQYLNGFHFDVATSAHEIDAVMRADAGAGQTTISMDTISRASYALLDASARERLVLGGGSCTFMRYPDYRTVTDLAVRRAIAYAYPYRSSWEAIGLIPGVTRLAASNVMPPGVVGRVRYDPLAGHAAGTTDPARARELLAQSGHLGYRIRFPYAADVPGATLEARLVVRGLRAGGFRASAVATTQANIGSDFVSNPNAAVNLRSVGWCADWPTGSAWIPPEFGSTDIAKEGFGSNFAAFSEPAVDARIAATQRLPLGRQPAGWNALDRLIQTRYFPVVVTGYNGVAMMRGSRVHDDHVDSVYSMPTWKDIWLGSPDP